MVTPEEMRLFAADCLRWSDQPTIPATELDGIAAAIERRLLMGDELALPDCAASSTRALHAPLLFPPPSWLSIDH